MQRLGDVAEEVDEEFERIGGVFGCEAAVLDALSLSETIGHERFRIV